MRNQRRLERKLPSAEESDRLRELHSQALANAKRYFMIGFLDRLPQTLRMLESLLQWAPFNRTTTHSNALSRCVPYEQLPREDVPTSEQRLQVGALLKHDVQLYRELENNFLQQYRERFEP